MADSSLRMTERDFAKCQVLMANGLPSVILVGWKLLPARRDLLLVIEAARLLGTRAAILLLAERTLLLVLLSGRRTDV